MKIIEVNTDTKVSRILIGERLNNLVNYLPETKVVIITDTNLLHHYRSRFPDNCEIIEIGLGEKNKTLDTLHVIFQKFVESEVDRSSFVVGIGGGIVCDVAGFAASIFMRGLKFGFVSTTLLSQVDASVGGKNGVNFQGFKNMIGVFNQPEFVICDEELFSTLDEKEFRAGFAEIVKAGAIKNAGLFGYLEDHADKALKYDPEVLNTLVYESVKIKANVVEEDEREKGERRKLNFGHTFAHAIEKQTGMLHGEAVSIGMVLAAELSVKLGLLTFEEKNRITKLLKNLRLPVSINTDLMTLFKAMKQDKKREGDSIHLVLLEKIGSAVIKKVSYRQLESMIHDLHQYIG